MQTEQRRLLAHLYRSRLASNEATLTLAEWEETIRHFSGLCAYCQQQPYETLEHVIRHADGGGTVAWNCVPACSRCNSMHMRSSKRLELSFPEGWKHVHAYLATKPGYGVIKKAPAPTNGLYLNSTQVSEWLGVSDLSVKRLLRNGEITAFKIGKSWHIREEEVTAFLERQKQKTEQAFIERQKQRAEQDVKPDEAVA